MTADHDSSDPDPRGLMADAYAMPDLDEAQCRSIFLDWLLGLPDGEDTQRAIRFVAARHADAAPDHPMTRLLRAGGESPPFPARRRRRGR